MIFEWLHCCHFLCLIVKHMRHFSPVLSIDCVNIIQKINVSLIIRSYSAYSEPQTMEWNETVIITVKSIVWFTVGIYRIHPIKKTLMEIYCKNIVVYKLINVLMKYQLQAFLWPLGSTYFFNHTLLSTVLLPKSHVKQ